MSTTRLSDDTARRRVPARARPVLRFLAPGAIALGCVLAVYSEARNWAAWRLDVPTALEKARVSTPVGILVLASVLLAFVTLLALRACSGRLSPVIRMAAPPAAAVLLVLTALAGRRAHSHADIHGFMGDFEPHVVRTSAVEVTRWYGYTPPYAPHGSHEDASYLAHEHGKNGSRWDPVRDVKIFQECHDTLGEERVADRPAARCKIGVAPVSAMSSAEPTVVDAPRLYQTGEIAVLYNAGAGVVLIRGCCESPVAFVRVEDQYEPTSLEPAYLAARTSPPFAWLAVAACGLVVIVGLCGGRFRATRRLRRLRAARTGDLDENGTITFEDGMTGRAEADSALPLGPVIVLGAVGGKKAYRDRDVVAWKEILPGTLAEREKEARFHVYCFDATVLAVAVLAATPLLAAASVGWVP